MTSGPENPLLAWEEYPDFGRIEPHHVEPALRAVLKQSQAELERLEQTQARTWHGLLVPLERLQDRVNRVWGVVTHLHRVRDCAALRTAHADMQPAVVEFFNRIAQSRSLYDALQYIAQSPEFARFSQALQRTIMLAVRNATLHGVGLEPEQRERFSALARELAELRTSFSTNVLDSTQDFALVLHKAEDVQGLPDDCLALAAAMAQRRGHSAATATQGPWAITLDLPSYLAFMQHSARRDLRQQVHRAYVTRAAHGQWDNAPLIRRIMAVRHEQATLLGFPHYAAMSLASKMAPSLDAVHEILRQLREAGTDPGLTDLIELSDLAHAHGQNEDIQPWDVLYWAERLKEQRLGLRDAELRPYFPLPAILDGLFALARHLFGVYFELAQAPVWHPDVRYYQVYNEHNERIGGCYFDLYARPEEKRSGAWMDELAGRSSVCAPVGSCVRLPVAYIIANQRPPLADQPALMSFAEVSTLFHEFGHALQHILTTVGLGFVAGVNGIEWDAVELASQFMENWCYDRPTLVRLARHYQTNEPLPPDMIDALLRSRVFRAGSATLRQVAFALTDLKLYTAPEPEHIDPIAIAQHMASEVLPLAPVPEDRSVCSFAHIFSGGYAAGYYSYKWAEVLSADAFSLFSAADSDQHGILGRRFRDTVLALGGSRPPMDVFRLFQGRDPDPKALLLQDGLLTQENI